MNNPAGTGQSPLPQLPPNVPDNPLVLTVLTHWNDARRNEITPARRNITMRGLGKALPFISIFEDLHDDFIVRLAGTEFRKLQGASIAGKTFREITPSQNWQKRVARHRIAANHPCGAWTVLNWSLIEGEYAQVGQLHLPLRNIGTAKNKGLLNFAMRMPRRVEQSHPGDPLDLIPLAIEFVPFSIGAGVPDFPAE